jgi:hypothetical protein
VRSRLPGFFRFWKEPVMPTKPITFDLAKLLSGSFLLKLVAMILAACGVYGAVGAVPKMASSAGAPINDVLNTLLPMLGAVATWFAANWFKVKPDLIQSVQAVFANPTDAVADLQLVAKLFGYLQEQWPNEPAMLATFGEGVKQLTDAVVKDLSKPAAKT